MYDKFLFDHNEISFQSASYSFTPEEVAVIPTFIQFLVEPIPDYISNLQTNFAQTQINAIELHARTKHVLFFSQFSKIVQDVFRLTQIHQLYHVLKNADEQHFFRTMRIAKSICNQIATMLFLELDDDGIRLIQKLGQFMPKDPSRDWWYLTTGALNHARVVKAFENAKCGQIYLATIHEIADFGFSLLALVDDPTNDSDQIGWTLRVRGNHEVHSLSVENIKIRPVVDENIQTDFYTNKTNHEKQKSFDGNGRFNQKYGENFQCGLINLPHSPNPFENNTDPSDAKILRSALINSQHNPLFEEDDE